MKKGFLHPWIWITFAILFLVSIPWYWAPDSKAMFLGFPLWAVVSVFGSFLISCFTAWLFCRLWPDEEEEP